MTNYIQPPGYSQEVVNTNDVFDMVSTSNVILNRVTYLSIKQDKTNKQINKQTNKKKNTTANNNQPTKKKKKWPYNKNILLIILLYKFHTKLVF